MEPFERDLIRERLTQLVLHTNCNYELLIFFHSEKILSLADIDNIAAENAGMDRALEFYKIIQTRTRAFAVLLSALKEYKQVKALQILSGEKSKIELSPAEVEIRVAGLLREQPTKSGISFDVLPPVYLFTGRTKEMEELHELVLRNKEAKAVTVISQLTTVAGLGGIGKTQLARHYAGQNAKEFNNNVVWLNAESENTLASSFQRLATEKLGLSTKDADGKEKSLKAITEDVYKYFEGSKALFVFDNADKTPWLREFLSTKKNCHSLITSRNREWDRGVKVLTLGVLSISEAIAMVKKGLDIADNIQDDEILQLVEAVQCFPLALQQAIAYISDQETTDEYSIENYIMEFQQQQLQMLSFREDASLDDDYLFTTATTWKITMDKIAQSENGPLAISLLHMIAYLNPDNIKRELFYQLSSNLDIDNRDSVNQESVKSAIRLLVKYSMLDEKDKHQRIVSVHRLVQGVTRDYLRKKKNEEEKHILKMTLDLLRGGEKKSVSEENIEHSLNVWKYAVNYSSLIKSHSWQVCDFLWKMHLNGILDHDEGVRFGNDALVRFKEVLGEKHWNCFVVQRCIACILRDNKEQYEKSVEIFEDLLAKAESELGKKSDFTLTIKADLGLALKNMGRYEKALKIYEEVLKDRQSLFGYEHPVTLEIETAYARTLMDSGEHMKALQIFQKLINSYIAIGKENGTEVPWLQGLCADIHFYNGNFKEAHKMYEMALKALYPFRIVDPGSYANVCYDLGYALCELGKYQEALEFMEGELVEIEKRLGAQHYRTLSIKSNIGEAHRGLGNFQKALEIHEDIQLVFIRVFGYDSMDGFMTRKRIADTLSHMGNHKKQFQCWKRSFIKLKKNMQKSISELCTSS